MSKLTTGVRPRTGGAVGRNVTEAPGPFKAYQTISYPSAGDRDRKTNGRLHYALASTEGRGRDAAALASAGVQVVLRAGCFKVTTPEGNCGILSAAGIIGLDQALSEGIALLRYLPPPGRASLQEGEPEGGG